MHAAGSRAIRLYCLCLRLGLYHTIYRDGYEGWFIAQCPEHWQHKPWACFQVSFIALITYRAYMYMRPGGCLVVVAQCTVRPFGYSSQPVLVFVLLIHLNASKHVFTNTYTAFLYRWSSVLLGSKLALTAWS